MAAHSWVHPKPQLQLTNVLKLLLCFGVLFITLLSYRPQSNKNENAQIQVVLNDNQLDQQLQRAATEALGQREGAIIVMDPQTGHIRALMNPQLALRTANSPGSTIKPFTTLAAFRSHLLDANSRIECREIFKHQDFNETCSHPRHLPPLNPSEALAYSCNYYFGKVAERLGGKAFNQQLKEFGFGTRTGIDIADESAGRLNRAKWKPQQAIGEDNNLKVTPMQLLVAYSAMLNGGWLLTPSLNANKSESRTTVKFSNSARAIVVDGMRKVITIGTAQSAALSSLPLSVIGKTGTTTAEKSFHSQGWFVGFSFTTSDYSVTPNLGLVVFLAKGHGADAAAISRSIFAEFSNLSSKYDATGRQINQPADDVSSDHILAHQVTENSTRPISLEEYVERVVATEGSIEDESEALKALAIAVRTFALKNLGRHKAQGYDFCSTTHCQRFGSFEGRVPDRVLEAVHETKGFVLRDKQAQLIDSYFGASCGGMTANIHDLWGQNAPDYLNGVRDEYCSSGQHYRWTDAIDSRRLAHALRSDQRTDVGETVHELKVVHTDKTGRAQLLKMVGNRTTLINGWDFKLIIGRSLGWNLLKSSRFSVSKSGSTFVFRGGGFGHGLGLCQEGAHVMAQRGYNFRTILAKYYPQTYVASVEPNDSQRANSVVLRGQADLLWLDTLATYSVTSNQSPRSRRTVTSEHFRLNYPATMTADEIADLMRLLENSRATLQSRLRLMKIDYQAPVIEVFLNETTGDFVGRTGQPPWAAAATKKNHIELQPLRVLRQRRILETTFHHEFVHIAIDSLGQNRSPRWLSEGLAMYVAGEGTQFERNCLSSRYRSLEELNQALNSSTTPEELKASYAESYCRVLRLIRTEGEAGVWQGIKADLH